jgi:hypothetical protein
MLGLVTAMGLAGERSAPGVAPAPPVVVVVHRTPSTAAPSPPNPPVRLVANPVVRAVPAPAAGSGPVARTNGSR